MSEDEWGTNPAAREWEQAFDATMRADQKMKGVEIGVAKMLEELPFTNAECFSIWRTLCEPLERWVHAMEAELEAVGDSLPADFGTTAPAVRDAEIVPFKR